MAPHPQSAADLQSIKQSLKQHAPTIYLICLMSFFISFRPGEPFLTPFLIDEKGLLPEDVNEKVYPLWTYSFFAFLLPVGLLSDRIGYRYVISAQFVCLLCTYAVLILCDTVEWMRFMQITFGFASACSACVFSTFIYKCCPPAIYQKINAYQRCSALVGHVVGALSGQLLVSTGHSKWQLFVISFIAFVMAMCVFLIIPSTDKDKRNNQTNQSNNQAVNTSSHWNDPPLLGAPTQNMSVFHLLRAVKSQYSNPAIALFSLYVVLGHGVLDLVLNYDTTLFYEIDPSADYNGLVLAIGWLCAAVAAFLPSIHSINQFGQAHLSLILTVIPALGALSLLASAYTDSILVAYTLFDAFYGLMTFVLSWSSGSIASYMSISAFSVVFAVNTFASLAIQTLLQLVIGEWAFRLNIREKYCVFAAQLGFVALVFGVITVKQHFSKSSQPSVVNPLKAELINEEDHVELSERL